MPHLYPHYVYVLFFWYWGEISILCGLHHIRMSVNFHCVGVTPSRSTLRFLLLEWLGWTPWYFYPMSSWVLSPLMITCLAPLVPTLVAPQLRCVGFFRVWPSLFLLYDRPAVGVGDAVRVYLLWPGVVAVVLGILCVGGREFGSMGAAVVSAWTSWKNFLRTLPPSEPFFPPPGWISLHFLLPLPFENPHQLVLPQRS